MQRLRNHMAVVVDDRLPVEDAIELDLPVEESDEYETIAGWMLVRLGHIPVPGERVEQGGVGFQVQAIRRRRIARLLVERDDEGGAGPIPAEEA